MGKFRSNEEYQSDLLNEFNNSTPQQLVQQMSRAEDYLSQLFHDIDEERYDFIKSIIDTAKQQREITFKQWKALSAFCRDCERLTKAVTLKKSLVDVGDKNEIMKSLPSGVSEMDTQYWSKERKEAYEQYLSKQKLSEDIEKHLDNYFKQNPYVSNQSNGTPKKTNNKKGLN